MAEKSKAPEGFVPKYRKREGRIRHDIRVTRFWKHKQTGTRVEVIRAMLVDGTHVKVVIHNEATKLQTTVPFEQLVRECEEVGNMGTGSWGRDE